MKYTVTIGVLMVAVMLLFTVTVDGADMRPTAVDEQMAKAYVEVKCDPCDYNIDYGDTKYPAEKGGVDEGTVKLKCDPCDYNIDYGDTDSHIEN